jgi:hypothetical protein
MLKSKVDYSPYFLFGLASLVAEEAFDVEVA